MNDFSKLNPVNEETIEVMAAAWLAQRDEGFTQGQSAEFTRWLQMDPRCAEAVARLEETCGILEELRHVPDEALVRGDQSPQSRVPARKIVSFPAVKLITAIAAAVALLASIKWLRPQGNSYAQTYSTTSEGYERVMLPDHSVIELNSSSQIHVQYSPAERRVILVSGEAHFSVSKNKARPFVVWAGRTAVRAVGTAFDVRMNPNDVEVLVTEGRVQVIRAKADMPVLDVKGPVAPQILDAGQRALIATNDAIAPKVESVAPAFIGETLAWQAPKLAFADTPLAEVVEEFNRHNKVQLIVGDSELGALLVGGNFNATNVDAFVRLLERNHDFVVERRSANQIVLLKPR